MHSGGNTVTRVTGSSRARRFLRGLVTAVTLLPIAPWHTGTRPNRVGVGAIPRPDEGRSKGPERQEGRHGMGENATRVQNLWVSLSVSARSRFIRELRRYEPKPAQESIPRGEEIPDASSVTEAKQDQELAAVNVQVLGRALIEARQDVANLIGGKYLNEIESNLQKAFDANLARVRELAPELQGFELDPNVIIAAARNPSPFGENLRSARRSKPRYVPPNAPLGGMRTTIDTHGYFVEFRHPDRFESRTFRNEVESRRCNRLARGSLVPNHR